MKYNLHALFFGVLLALGLHTNAQNTLSLDECINIAQTKTTTVLKGNNQIALSGAQVLQSYGQFLPDLNGGLGFGYYHGKNLNYFAAPSTVESKNFGINYQVVTSLNLFNGLADISALKSSLATKQSTELTLERAKQLIAYDVVQTYLQITLDKQIVDFTKQNVQYSVEREKQLTELTKAGRKALADLYQQQAQTSQDKLTQINAETRQKNDEVLLVRKLRLDANNNYTFTNAVADTTPLAEQYVDQTVAYNTALTQRTDVRAFDYALQAADWNVKRAKSGYLPKLNFAYGVYGVSRHINSYAVNGVTGNTDGQRSFSSQLGDQAYGSLGLNLTWTLFDKLNTKYAITTAKIYAENIRIDQEDLKLQIAADLKQAYNEYRAALQAIETANLGLVSANQSYETINGKYLAGAANFIDVVNAQTTLLQARQNKAQAITNLMLQKRVIDLYLGNKF